MKDRHEPMTAAERMRRYRARQAGQNIPMGRPGPPPSRPRDLSGIPLPQLLAEVTVRLDELLPVRPAETSRSSPHPSDIWSLRVSASGVLGSMGDGWDETAWLEGRDWKDREGDDGEVTNSEDRHALMLRAGRRAQRQEAHCGYGYPWQAEVYAMAGVANYEDRNLTYGERAAVLTARREYYAKYYRKLGLEAPPIDWAPVYRDAGVELPSE